jgi:hypothetical protein
MTSYEERQAVREYRAHCTRVYRIAGFVTICIASTALIGMAGITLFWGLVKYWDLVQTLTN